jgi:hypothetical protein
MFIRELTSAVKILADPESTQNVEQEATYVLAADNIFFVKLN